MYSQIDTLWVLLATTLVFFMQAGFAMVETGFTRAKNAGNIIMKNLMDFALGTLTFWFIGFGLMYNGTDAFIGQFDFFIQNDYSSTIPSSAFVMFQTVFCATAATIVSGAMAERTKFSSYCIYSIIISTFIYPVSGHWIWGGGFLAQMGFHDFAGSTAVHLVGGIAALVGAKTLGPRIGKYSKSGKPRAILGHNLTLGALGVFILWFCWFGFNAGSTLGLASQESTLLAANIFITTNIAAAAAATAVMIITWVRYKKPDVSMTLNGALAGLVAITAGCDTVTPFGAFFIGIISAFVVVFGIEFIDKKLKIDDPVGAVGVHGMCGFVGTVLVGLFSTNGGLFYDGGTSLLLTQIFGVLVVCLWVSVTMTIVFQLIKRTVGLRVTESEELIGLDIEEHGLTTSYADFIPVTTNGHATQTKAEPIEKAIPVVNNKTTQGENKLTKLSIVTNPAKFSDLKNALDQINITGMTVSEVLGCGMQKGSHNYYRGSEVESVLLPKIKVEIVICKVPLNLTLETIKSALYTGNIGDGKIFIYDVENVIKVRTSEEGYDALQDE